MHGMWTCEKVVVEFEFEEKSGFLGKEAREARLTFQCTWYNTWACFCLRQRSTSPRALTIRVLFLLSNYTPIQTSTRREETCQHRAKTSPYLADESVLPEHEACIAWLQRWQRLGRWSICGSGRKSHVWITLPRTIVLKWSSWKCFVMPIFSSLL